MIRRLDVGRAWFVPAHRHRDDRGWFQEWFRRSSLAEDTGFDFRPVQANISLSASGVVRGIHYSVAAEGQGKLVTVLRGAIDDYVIDLVEGSATFGQWERVRLTADEGGAVLLDPHMGHAFQALEDDTVVSYLVSAEYNPEAELAITPLCPTVAIDWHHGTPLVLSDRDRAAPDLVSRLRERELPGRAS